MKELASGLRAWILSQTEQGEFQLPHKLQGISEGHLTSQRLQNEDDNICLRVIVKFL